MESMRLTDSVTLYTRAGGEAPTIQDGAHGVRPDVLWKTDAISQHSGRVPGSVATLADKQTRKVFARDFAKVVKYRHELAQGD
jgi:hypothetical protein